MAGLTPAHLLIILVIALIVIGPGKLPEVGAAIGKSFREFQKASSGIAEAVTGPATAAAQTPVSPPQTQQAAVAPGQFAPVLAPQASGVAQFQPAPTTVPMAPIAAPAKPPVQSYYAAQASYVPQPGYAPQPSFPVQPVYAAPVFPPPTLALAPQTQPESPAVPAPAAMPAPAAPEIPQGDPRVG